MSSGRKRPRNRRPQNRVVKKQGSEIVEKTTSVRKPNKVDNVLGALLVVSMFLLIVAFGPLGNTIGGVELFLQFLVVGILMGILAAGILLRIQNLITSREAPAIVLLCLFFLPSFATLANYYLFGSNPYRQQYIVTGKISKIGRRGGQGSFNLYIIPKNRSHDVIEQSVRVDKAFWHSVEYEETLTLTLYSGLLGYPVIEKIDKIANVSSIPKG